MSKLSGLGQKSRRQLGAVLKGSKGTITPTDAAKILQIPQSNAAQLLSRWEIRGWLTRIKRGVYIPVPLEAESTEIAVAEPWILAQRLFDPCYIGGWSAAEHWDFTEQIFHSIIVVTTRKVHQRDLQLKGIRFRVKTVVERALFGMKAVWIEGQKVSLSDPTRTILDFFNDPSLGGGIRSVIDMFSNYMRSPHKNITLLLQYAEKLQNGAVYKRLGFLLEQMFPEERDAIQTCRNNLKTGYSQLDPQTPSKKLATAWHLWVPITLKQERERE